MPYKYCSKYEIANCNDRKADSEDVDLLYIYKSMNYYCRMHPNSRPSTPLERTEFARLNLKIKVFSVWTNSRISWITGLWTEIQQTKYRGLPILEGKPGRYSLISQTIPFEDNRRIHILFLLIIFYRSFLHFNTK